MGIVYRRDVSSGEAGEAMARLRKAAVIGGVVGGIGWVRKMIVMAAQGGPDLESLPESIAFVVGLVGVIVASACTGTYLASKASGSPRAGGRWCSGRSGSGYRYGPGWLQRAAG